MYCRYEDEINKRTALENEFVVLKKVRGVAKLGEVVLQLSGVWVDLERARPQCLTILLALPPFLRMWMLRTWAGWICMAKWTP